MEKEAEILKEMINQETANELYDLIIAEVKRLALREALGKLFQKRLEQLKLTDALATEDQAQLRGHFVELQLLAYDHFKTDFRAQAKAEGAQQSLSE